MRDAFVQQLENEAEANRDVILVTGDLGFGIFDRFVERFPKQFINAGVAEQNMTGIATGLALEGKKVFTYSIANFASLRCLEQIRNDAAYHKANLTVVASGGGFTYGSLGMSHHATEDLAILRALPDVAVVAPGSAWEAGQATAALCHRPGVSYLRIEKGGSDEPPYPGAAFRVGEALMTRDGTDITLVAVGGIVAQAQAAAEMLAKQGVQARVLSMHTIKPIDQDAIESAVRETGAIVTIEEHVKQGGLAGAVAETLMVRNLHAYCGQVAVPDEYTAVVGDQDYLQKHYGLDAKGILNVALEVLAVKNR